MLKREWGAESNGKLPHLVIPSKTATFVPKFAMEDLPLSRIVALVPVTQRARVRSPVETSFLGMVFPGCFLTCKTNVRKIIEL